MGAWSEINRFYHMTQADWDEWRRVKAKYKKRRLSFICGKCSKTVLLSPFNSFLLAKGKMKRLCDDCGGGMPK
jgi:hypothetical protein